MPANIDKMMFNKANGVPWHGLGTPVNGLATAEQAIVAAGLDWNVNVEDMALAADGRKVPNHFAVVRSDNRAVLGVVGNRFEPLQNRKAFAAFDAPVGAGEAIYETAGSLGIGEKVWLLAKLPDSFEVVPGDVVKKYVLLAMGHDGSMSVKLGKTAVRCVCENTLNLALSAKDNFISIRHTGDVSKRTQEAFVVLGIVKKQYAEIENFFKFLASRPLFGENLKGVVNAIFPSPEGEKISTRLTNIRDTVLFRIENGKGTDLPGVRGTAWGAFNGVVEYLDHFRVQKGAEDDAEGARSRRMDAILFGNVATTRERAAKIIAEAVA
jgi:phage/plasmid-like protein (TIGR03299 family)